MPESVDGREPLELGPLGFGAANLGNLYREISDEQAWAALDAAWDAGIRYFDTAPHYGLGLSEKRLGAFLQTKPRNEFVISTKVGRLLRPNPDFDGQLDLENSFAVPAALTRVWDASEAGIRASHEESLERLGLDAVDILFLHDPDGYDIDSADATGYPALIDLRDRGVVRGVGIGSMNTAALTRAAKTPGLDLHMFAGRLTLAEQSVMPEATDAAIANAARIVAAGVYNSGILATNSPGADARYEYGGVPAEFLAHVTAIAAICAEHGVDLPTAALQYTLRVKPVASVVFGGARPEQITENARRMHETIPEQLWSALGEAGLIPWQ
ncbi:MAG: aldo/keto reductase [Rhodoglobus sp.]